MTKIVFFRSGGVFYGFEEQGHAGFASAGDDILCAALSSMTMFLVNTIEVAYSSKVDYDIDEGATRITVRAKAALPEFESDDYKRYAVSGIMMGYYLQLSDMLEEYGDYLDVSVKDRAWEDYLRLCRAAGSKGYFELLEVANLSNPFREGSVEKAVRHVIDEIERNSEKFRA